MRASLAGELAPVIGTCPACGQPMVGEGPREAYAIPVEGGVLTLDLDGALVGPTGPLSPEAAAELVRRSWPEVVAPLGERLFTAVVLGLMLIPAALGAFMIWFVFWYLANVGGSP